MPQKRADWLVFSVSDEQYAHPIDRIREILPYSEPAPLPGSPNRVQGMLNIRGDIVSILSAKKMLQLPTNDASNDAGNDDKIMTLETNAGLFGVVIDSVDEIIKLDSEHIEPQSHSSPSDIITGTIHHNQQLLILSDFVGACEEAAEDD